MRNCSPHGNTTSGPRAVAAHPDPQTVSWVLAIGAAPTPQILPLGPSHQLLLLSVIPASPALDSSPTARLSEICHGTCVAVLSLYRYASCFHVYHRPELLRTQGYEGPQESKDFTVPHPLCMSCAS
jgi:hypothetical protein